MDGDQIKQLAGAAQAAAISSGSAAVAQLVDVIHNGAKFSWAQWGVIVVLAAWWGLMLDSALPDPMPGRGAAIALLGGLGAMPAFVAARAAVPGIVNSVVDYLKSFLRR